VFVSRCLLWLQFHVHVHAYCGVMIVIVEACCFKLLWLQDACHSWWYQHHIVAARRSIGGTVLTGGTMFHIVVPTPHCGTLYIVVARCSLWWHMPLSIAHHVQCATIFNCGGTTFIVVASRSLLWWHDCTLSWQDAHCGGIDAHSCGGTMLIV
jgi:hypothetical protein